MQVGHGRRRRSRALFAGALVGILSGLSGEVAAQGGDVVLREGRGVVRTRYFGLHLGRAAAERWSAVPFATWSLADVRVSWPSLQPARGKWSWDELDRLIDLAEERNAQPILPLGLTPAWASARPEERSPYGAGRAAEPADLDDWRRYVEAVVGRYKGRVHLYAIWSQPDLKQSYTGSVEDMVRLCRDAREVIKRADPRNLVISPTATRDQGVSWLDRFLAAGGRECFDVVGFDLRATSDPPERMIARVAEVRRVMANHGVADRPLWNIEDGWYVESGRPVVARRQSGAPRPVSGAAAMTRALVLARAAGVARFYWSAGHMHGLVDLVERVPSGTGSVRALAEVQRWLVGAALLECRGAAGVWICPLTRGARRAWVVWSSTGSRRFAAPRSWHAAAVRDLDGGRRELSGRGWVTIGPAPLLVEGGL